MCWVLKMLLKDHELGMASNHYLNTSSNKKEATWRWIMLFPAWLITVSQEEIGGPMAKILSCCESHLKRWWSNKNPENDQLQLGLN